MFVQVCNLLSTSINVTVQSSSYHTYNDRAVHCRACTDAFVYLIALLGVRVRRDHPAAQVRVPAHHGAAVVQGPAVDRHVGRRRCHSPRPTRLRQARPRRRADAHHGRYTHSEGIKGRNLVSPKTHLFSGNAHGHSGHVRFLTCVELSAGDVPRMATAAAGADAPQEHTTQHTGEALVGM